MKALFRISLFTMVSLIAFSSCKTSSDVVSNSLISKRKYRTGFHMNVKAKDKKSSDWKQAQAQVKERKKFFQEKLAAKEDVRVLNSTNSSERQLVVHKPGKVTQSLRTLKAMRQIAKEVKKTKFTTVMASKDVVHAPPAEGGNSQEDIFALVAFISAMAMLVFGLVPNAGAQAISFLGWLGALICGFLGLKSEKWKWMAVVALVHAFLAILLFLLVVVLLILILGAL